MQLNSRSSHAEGNPGFKSPPGGCDAHFHVFGPAGRYPHNQADLRYARRCARRDFLALSKKLGLERFVFVQPRRTGATTAACWTRCARSARRTAAASSTSTKRAQTRSSNGSTRRACARAHQTSAGEAHEAGFAATLPSAHDRLRGRCAEIGRQLDFLTPGWLTAELMRTLAKIEPRFQRRSFGMFSPGTA